MPCSLPPNGWFCTRPAGHEGPCAAYPMTKERHRETHGHQAMQHYYSGDKDALRAYAERMADAIWELQRALRHFTGQEP